MYYLQSRYYDPATSRFINGDSFASTGLGIIGYNMFSYCNNNPEQHVDPYGHRMEARVDFGGYGGAGFAYVGGIGVAAYLGAKWDDFTESVEKSLARITTPKQYKSDTEIHHIAAQKSRNAKAAQEILWKVFPNDGTENFNNKVVLKTVLHRRVHTKLYYAITNTLIIKAYYSADGNEDLARENVIKTLNEISTVLSGLNALTSE